MLLKFTTADMLNTALIDVSTGERAYDIVTVLQSPPESTSDPASSSSPTSPSPPPPSSLSASLHSKPPCPSPTAKVERRETTITDASGKTICTITWAGRQPDITIGDEKIGGLTDLFGSSTIRFMPKILAIPTRFDTEYIWTATPDSLTLFDYDSEQTKGTFHQNAIRLPSTSKASPSLAATSRTASPSSTFINTHLPGLGNNYLEFCHHPLAESVEIIVSFLMMEILRRGRFCLTPYTFQRPKLWQFREARDLVMRRLRRNTV